MERIGADGDHALVKGNVLNAGAIRKGKGRYFRQPTADLDTGSAGTVTECTHAQLSHTVRQADGCQSGTTGKGLTADGHGVAQI